MHGELIHIDHFHMWQDMVRDRIAEGDCKRSNTDFRASLLFRELGDIRLARIVGMDFQFDRLDKHIARSRQDRLTFFLQMRGFFHLAQDGRACVVRPGQFACHDSSRPFSLSSEPDYEQFILQVPCSAVAELLGPSQRFTGSTLGDDSPAGSAVVSFLGKLSEIFEDLSPSAATKIADIAISLITIALSNDDSIPETAGASHVLFHRAKSLIQENCSDALLRAEDVAAKLGISHRYLQRIFQTHGLTPSGHIWHCRLRSSRRHLANPTMVNLSINQIATLNGFSDVSHFCARFRAVYGASPRAYRAEALKKTGIPSDSSPDTFQNATCTR